TIPLLSQQILTNTIFPYTTLFRSMQMYKVFVNEKKLTLSKYPEDIEKKLRYEGFATLEIAVDLLQNTSCPALNVYSENLAELWRSEEHTSELQSRENFVCRRLLEK